VVSDVAQVNSLDVLNGAANPNFLITQGDPEDDLFPKGKSTERNSNEIEPPDALSTGISESKFDGR